MSICRGAAGLRGGNPRGIFIHNDAGSQNANAAFYRKWLQTHPLENGFAHAYVASDGILYAEDDAYAAWHCGQTDGNRNYYSIEVCQSMGDLEIFKKNEENALKLAAQKCKQYGIVPNTNTIRLHKEVFATACPHRSVEIHGGTSGCKTYFINKTREYMGMDKLPDAPVVSGGGSSAASGDPGIVFTYGVMLTDGTILPFVNNLSDFAGLPGRTIAGIAIKVIKGTVKYRVHVKGKGWLPYVTGCNWSDANNGYAGYPGAVIDAVEVYYDTPADIVAKYGYQKAQYRVAPIGGGYYPWQFDNEVGNGQDGYAGCFGIALDKFQLY